MKKKFLVEGMTCASCQSHVENTVSNLKGVNEVNVSLLTNSMNVDYDDKLISEEEILLSVSKIGYKASFNKNKEKKTNKELVKLIVSFSLLLLLMYVAMGHMLSLPIPSFLNGVENSVYFALTQLVITIPIIIIYRRYYVSGIIKLIRRVPNMDSLIALGSISSLIYGIFGIGMMIYGLNTNDLTLVKEYRHNLYFESSAMILTLVSLGKYFELLSKNKTTSAINKLIDLSPKFAYVEDNDKIIKIPVEEVKVGDIVICKKGEQIPVDGKVIEGNCSVDQSNITGESVPVEKKINDDVISSTILTSGYVKVKATKVGKDTSINTIIKLVEEASSSKAPISKLVDRISLIFVPLIIIISFITFVINLIINNNFELSFNFAISVLVISCPCALGLATPVAIMVSSGKGAENGLLIKNAEILEKAHLIKTIVLDKTGTITEGKQEIVKVEKRQENLLDIVYSLEKLSEHPLAKSITLYCEKNSSKEIKFDSFKSLDGIGLLGNINDDNYLIGNARVLEYLDINDQSILDKMNKDADKSNIPLVIYKNKEMIGYILLKDKIKESSILAIKKLHELGIEVIMLTGDNKNVANNVAKEVGIDKVFSEVYPQDKQRIINSLKKDQNHLVAMVGDGVNDALALTSADLGIAIGSGSDIALESSDIVLIKNNLIDVCNVIKLSSRTLNVIKGNLFWAFFYNCIGIILASGLFYYSFGVKLNPMIGSLAMSFSSVFVVLNALTINLFKTVKLEVKEETKEKVMENKVVIKVEGMMCPHCKKRVEDIVKTFVNIVDVNASLEEKNVSITYLNEVNVDAIIEAISSQGYPSSK